MQAKTLYVGSLAVAKMGTTTQYDYIGPSGERYPVFYSALIARGRPNDPIQGCYWPDKVRIEVKGVAPNGAPLTGDRFTGRSILSSPDESGVEQWIIKVVFDVLIDILPSGLSAVAKNTITEGGATTDRDIEKAWGEWCLGS